MSKLIIPFRCNKISRLLKKNFTTSLKCYSEKPNVSPIVAEGKPGEAKVASQDLPQFLMVTSYWDKKFIVWLGKSQYKTVDDVPEKVSMALMEKARSKARIKLANIFMILTVLGCIGFAISGKKAAERGESVSQMNFDWHEKYNEMADAIEKKK